MLIVHDFAYDYGGAERVTAALARAFPEARVLAVGARASVLARMQIEDRTTTVLPLDRLRTGYRYLSPVLPRLVARTVDDAVLSSSYAFAHHVRSTRVHIEYCHSPLRQLWVAEEQYRDTLGSAMRFGMALFDGYLRRADRRAVANVDTIVASCENVRRRVRAVYDRDATIVYPPVSLGAFYAEAVPRERDLVMLVARLVEPYKQVAAVLDLFADLPYRLVVAGDGRDATRLHARAPANVTFVGHVGDDDLRALYSRASVVVFPSEDDFGIVPIEAMACGTPVVALDLGGARETVVHDVTGLRYPHGGLREALIAAMERGWDHNLIRSHAVKFGDERFVDQMQTLVADALAAGRRRLPS